MIIYADQFEFRFIPLLATPTTKSIDIICFKKISFISTIFYENDE